MLAWLLGHRCGGGLRGSFLLCSKTAPVGVAALVLPPYVILYFCLRIHALLLLWLTIVGLGLCGLHSLFRVLLGYRRLADHLTDWHSGDCAAVDSR